MRAHMLDKCPLDSYEAVSRTVTEDLGAPPESLFASFEPHPIASASLAQVRWVLADDPENLGLWMPGRGKRRPGAGYEDRIVMLSADDSFPL